MYGTRAAVRAWTVLAAAYLAGSAALVGLAVPLASPLRDGWAAGQAGALDRALGAAAAVVAWTLLTWLVVGTGAELVRLTRCAEAPRRAPRLATRLAALLLGASLAATGAAGTALARSTSPAATAAVDLPALDRPAPTPATPARDGWTPDRPAAPPRPGAPVRLVSTAPRAGQALAEEVVVRRGDTLWDIAERHLGPAATAEAVAAEWPRWYAANRDVIGDDPDLIHPGQRLRPPGR